MKKSNTKTKKVYTSFESYDDAYVITDMLKKLSTSALSSKADVDFLRIVINSATDTMTRRFKRVLQ